MIIPAYNTSPYIHRAIESSVRQTHSNIEIIIIDDGSADDTLKVSQSYAEKDSRIRVIHQDNG
ncbi:MAG: glycosyltransferase family 2 protein, partial [Synergistaceae bacterium]|nr:glycosyltransferase family 2 protein [Synergistaceae bacterium]